MSDLANSLSTLDPSRIPSGVLVNRVIPISNPIPYDGTSTSPKNTLANWLQQYWQFYHASLAKSNLTTPDQLSDLIQAKLDAGQVPLLVMNYQYEQLRADAESLGLIRVDSLNERFYDGPNRTQSPYLQQTTFAVAIPSPLTADGGGTLYVGREFWFGNRPVPTGINIDLGDGTGSKYVAMGSTVQLVASVAGSATTPRIVSVNNAGSMAFATVKKAQRALIAPNQALGIYATRQWPNTDKRPSGIAWVKWGEGNTSGKFQKTLIFVEGIDFEDRIGNPDEGNDRKHNYFIKHPPTTPGIAPISLADAQFVDGWRNGEAGWDEMVDYNGDYKMLEKLPSLRSSLQAAPSSQTVGYDIVYLDFTDGADQIENNAMLLVDLLTYIDNNKQGNNNTIVMGASMGGQVARFALAWMEEQKLCNGVNLYISFDSPHRGANVALGVQHLLNRLAQVRFAGRGNLLERRGFLNRPASRQMLNYHFDPDAEGMRNAWQGWQSSPTSFPTYLRKVAVSNGDAQGRSLSGSWPGMELLHTDKVWTSKTWGENYAYALPGATSRGVNNVVFRYKKDGGIRWHYVTVPSTTPAYDTSPGGTRQTTKDFNEEAPLYFVMGATNDTFIPAISALGITDAAVGTRSSTNVNYNITNNIPDKDRPDQAKYSFDAYFASTVNEPHIQITDGSSSPNGNPTYLSNNSAWVIKEIQESDHALQLTLSTQYNFGSIFRRYLPTITIANGGILLVNATGIPVSGGTVATQVNPVETNFDLYAASCGRVIITQGGNFKIGNATGPLKATVRFGSSALLDLQTGSQVTIHPNSILKIQRGATLVIRNGAQLQNNGQIIVETGAYVCIENTSSILGQKPVYQPGVIFSANPALNLGTLACKVDCTNTLISIVGNPRICNSSDYKVEGLPTGATVTWSIPSTAGSVLQLQPNVPKPNELRIINQKWYTVSTTLTATIGGAVCGTTSKVLTKTIANDNSAAYFPYSQGACTVNNTSYPSTTGTATSGQSVFVKRACTVYVDLGNADRTVTLASGQPAFWGRSTNSYYPNTLYFQIPITSDGGPCIFNVDTKSDCGIQQLTFFPSSTSGTYTYMASPNPAGEEVTVTATENTTETLSQSTKSKHASYPLTYTVEVYEVMTGALKMVQHNENGNLKTKLNISRLRSGHYVLHIQDGESSQMVRIVKE